jgi:hypothetical protein
MSPHDVKVGIVRQLYVALEKPGADEEVLSFIGSWCDTLKDTYWRSAPPGARVGIATPLPSAAYLHLLVYENKIGGD